MGEKMTWHRKGGSAKGAALLAAAALLCLAAYAQAEAVQDGKVLVKVGGGITPTKLPRSTPAPIGVLMDASITTTDKSVPPELKEILLGINNHGILQTKGLPTCSLAKLETLTGPAAKQLCGAALVGHGNVTTRIALPGQGAFSSNGTLQAFNGRLHGRQAIFAQVTAERPLALNFVMRFEVRKGHGEFGTNLIGTVPPIASGYGEITSIDLALKRTYAHAGKKMSFLSADCPAPKGFPGVTFSFARTSFAFADGTKAQITLTRSCKVRG
jgi:hypothetical protein